VGFLNLRSAVRTRPAPPFQKKTVCRAGNSGRHVFRRRNLRNGVRDGNRYFKRDADSARLTVVATIRIRSLHFHKADGRNDDDLRAVTAIFDNNGNFVLGSEKRATMQLLDAAHDHLSHTGVSVKSNFAMKPGHPMVRKVVRDPVGASIDARTGIVEIRNSPRKFGGWWRALPCVGEIDRNRAAGLWFAWVGWVTGEFQAGPSNQASCN
jgi:hypothetical protein